MAALEISERRISPRMGAAIVLVLAVAGLFYVKWWPYYDRAFVSAAKHSIGHSILMGDASHAPEPSLKSALDYALAYGNAIWRAMVLGLLLGSAVQEFAPKAWIARTLGRSGFLSVTAGAILAIPGMMCTCCAAPVVIGLRRRNASAAAAMAFWLGNTVLNPATLVFMGFVLGWKWTGLRLVLGLPLVLGTGYLVSRLGGPADAIALRARLGQVADEFDSTRPTLRHWLRRFIGMTVQLIPEYLVLVLLLGAVRAWIFPDIGPEISNELRWIALMSAAGLLFVIPTAGEVPIVQAMLALGMGSGPAAALMMTLAPISLPSLAMTGSIFSVRVLGLVVGTVFVAGVMAGLVAAYLNF